MKGAVLYGPQDVRLEDVKEPSINNEEVLVKVEIALTCGTDAKVYLRGGHPKMIHLPSLFGHEWAGVIKKVGKNVHPVRNRSPLGDRTEMPPVPALPVQATQVQAKALPISNGVKDFKEGDRVVAANSAPCLNCYYCGIGRFSLCENLTFLNGAYAEYIKIPEAIVKTNLFKIPKDVTYEEAAFLEPLSCVVHGVEEIGVRKNEEVVIIGAGPIGLMFLLILKNIGAKVTIVEKNGERLKIAESLGCDNVVLVKENEDAVKEVKKFSNRGKGMDVAIEATGIPKIWEDSIKMVKGGGRVLLFGGCEPGEKVTIDTGLIHYSEITIRGVFHHTPYYVKKAYDLIAERRLNLTSLITDRLPLSEIQTALDKIVNGEGIKIAIIP